MKRNVLLSLLVAFAFIGYTNAQSELCFPSVDYYGYACISKVEMNGVVSESSTGVAGEVYYDDYTTDASRLFKVEPGKTYELKVTFSNFDSGVTDWYYISAYFDWNDNLVLEESERYDELFSAGRKGGFVTKTFQVTVPENAKLGKVHMRVQTFYYEDGFPMDPCDWMESGEMEDYLIEVGASTGVNKIKSGNDLISVYPNPATDIVNFTEAVSHYSLYSVDGVMVQQGEVVSNSISVANRLPGVYVLKAQTDNGVKMSNIIVK